MLRLAQLIFRNVLRNRRRSLLTLDSTAVSLTLLAIMAAAYQGFFHGADTSPSEARRLVTRHRVSLTQALPASYMQQIARVEGVQAISAWSWFQGTYIDNKHFFARFAVDADQIFKIHDDRRIVTRNSRPILFMAAPPAACPSTSPKNTTSRWVIRSRSSAIFIR